MLATHIRVHPNIIQTGHGCFTYRLLRITQLLPCIGSLDLDFRNRAVPGLNVTRPILHELDESRAGTLDLTIVLDHIHSLSSEATKGPTGIVSLLDLQRSVRFHPFFIGSIICSAVLVDLRLISLKRGVSKNLSHDDAGHI